MPGSPLAQGAPTPSSPPAAASLACTPLARVSFVGGTTPLDGLARRAGEKGVAFSLFPTTMSDLVAAADSGRPMPPKSTWFEPKVKSGLFIRRINHCESVLDGPREKKQ